MTCSNCGRPICPDCMTEAPVGQHCPVCTGRARDDAAGRAAYRARATVVRRTERTPLAGFVRGASVTKAIVGANVAILLAMFVSGRGDATAPDVLLRFGAMPPVLEVGQWWRMVTAMFVHIGLLHLLFNSWALILFGGALEERHGRGRFIALYLAAGVMGSAFSLAFTEGGIRAGASGGVFGILGAWLAFFLAHRDVPALRGQLRSVLFLVGINLFFGATVTGVDNFAHIGGLVAGFAIGWTLEHFGRRRGAASSAWVAALVGSLLVSFWLASAHMV